MSDKLQSILNDSNDLRETLDRLSILGSNIENSLKALENKNIEIIGFNKLSNEYFLTFLIDKIYWCRLDLDIKQNTFNFFFELKSKLNKTYFAIKKIELNKLLNLEKIIHLFKNLFQISDNFKNNELIDKDDFVNIISHIDPNYEQKYHAQFLKYLNNATIYCKLNDCEYTFWYKTGYLEPNYIDIELQSKHMSMVFNKCNFEYYEDLKLILDIINEVEKEI